MKHFVCIVLVSFLTDISTAQAPSWSWAVSGGGNKSDDAYRVAADGAGNIYVVGSFGSDTLRLGGFHVRRAGSLSTSADFFVAKLNSSGVVQWLKSSGTARHATCYGVALDASGNVYIAGTFMGTATFGSIAITTTTADAFVAKLTPDGDYIWVQKSTSGAGSSAGAYDLFVTAGGEVLVTGFFLGAPTFGLKTLSHPSNGSGIFVGKLSADGSWQWALDAGGTSTTRDFNARDIVADTDGNAYLTGNFKATATFGATALTSSGDSDAFVARASSTGQWTWAQKGGGKGLDKGISIAIDRQNNIYVAGVANDTARFGNTTLVSTFFGMPFLVKYDQSGAALRAVRVPGLPPPDISSSLAVDSDNNVYISGSLNFGTAAFGSTVWQGTDAVGVFLAKMDVHGNYQWAVKSGALDNMANGLAIGPNGEYYIVGYFALSTTIGTSSLVSRGSFDFFIAKLSGTVSTSVERTSAAPSGFSLTQNYPNPFNPSTTITFDVPSAGAVSLAVFDMLGRRVATLVNEQLQPGRYRTTWDATGLPSGVYVYRLQAGGFVQTRKLLLAK
jgi:hypothetical protein